MTDPITPIRTYVEAVPPVTPGGRSPRAAERREREQPERDERRRSPDAPREQHDDDAGDGRIDVLV